MSGEITYWHPAETSTPALPEVGYIVSKPGTDEYTVGDEVTVWHFTNAEERAAAIAAAFFSRPPTHPRTGR